VIGDDASMRELHTLDDLRAATSDPLARWAGQALLPTFPGTGHAWAHGAAVGVHAPGLNRRDRFVLSGPAEDVAVILRGQLREHGPSLNPLVSSDLSEALRELLPDVVEQASFGWMQRAGQLPGTTGVRWLGEHELDDAEALLRKANPGSYVWPNEPAARRWAGVHVDGTLVAVGADAWSSPDVGFLAGVATHPDHRGRGLSTAICTFVASALLAEHGTCALMVDADNDIAIGLYGRLGFRYRSVTILLPDEVARSLPPVPVKPAGWYP
jgi:ribosomal protein S18 acetylase RimI-like enzyme